MTIALPGSRYPSPGETAGFSRHVAPDGRVIVYRRRRFLPPGETIPTVAHVVVIAGERLDRLAYRSFGDAEQAWRIADANNAMRPQALVAEPGRQLAIPLPQADAGWPDPDVGA